MEYPSETIEAITKFLFIGVAAEELNEVSDLVIVLGCHLPDLLITELKKLQDGGHISKNAKIVLSGKAGALDTLEIAVDTEARALLSSARNEGILRKNLVLETEATNTYENFFYSKVKIEELGGFDRFNSVLCIGQAFALRRAKMCASKCGYPMEKLTFYGVIDKNGRNIGPDSWWKSEAARKRVIEELGRISVYTLKGDLSIE